MNTSITIDILNPKATKLLKNLEELNLISIKSEKKGFVEVLKKLRANSKNAPSFEEITKEVEIVRTKRHEKQQSKNHS